MAKEIEFLVDTNVWLERLLEQEKSDEVKRFLDEVSPDILFISDFSVHSIAIIMSNLEKYDDYQYYIGQKYNLKIVTFDQDFKKSGIPTYEPKEALSLIKP